MPWCPSCDRYLAPPSVAPDGTCPTCHRPVQVADRHASRPTRRPPAEHADADDLAPVPWHFKLALVALAIYLLFRFAQLGGLLF